MRDPLLLHRTQTAIRAEVAVHTGSRYELAIGDSLSCGFHASTGGEQLCFAATGRYGHILFQVVENQCADGVPPFFPGGNCVQRQLQALVGIFLVSSLSGFVVDDSDRAIGPAIDAIDTAYNRDLSDAYLKRLFGMKNFRGRKRSGSSEEVT